MKTCSQCVFWAMMNEPEEPSDLGFCTVSLPMIIENQSRIDNTTNADDDAEDCNAFKQKHEKPLMQHDGNEDFTLNGERCWITVKGFAVCIHTTDEGVVVDIFDDYNVDAGSLSSCYAFDNEVGGGCGDDIPGADDVSCRNEEGSCGDCKDCPANADEIEEDDDDVE